MTKLRQKRNSKKETRSRARVQTDTPNVSYPSVGEDENYDNLGLILTRESDHKAKMAKEISLKIGQYPLLEDYANKQLEVINDFWSSCEPKDKDKARTSNIRIDSTHSYYDKIANSDVVPKIQSALMGLSDAIILADVYSFNRYGDIYRDALVKVNIKELKTCKNCSDLPEYNSMEEFHSELIHAHPHETVKALLKTSAKNNWNIALSDKKLVAILEYMLKETLSQKVAIAPYYGIPSKKSFISETRAISSQEGHKNILVQIALAATAHIVKYKAPITMSELAQRVGAPEATVTRAVHRALYFNTGVGRREAPGAKPDILCTRGRGLVCRVTNKVDTRTVGICTTLQGLNLVWMLVGTALGVANLLKSKGR